MMTYANGGSTGKSRQVLLSVIVSVFDSLSASVHQRLPLLSIKFNYALLSKPYLLSPGACPENRSPIHRVQSHLDK